MCAGHGPPADLIIVVDDDEAVRRALTLLLASYDWDVATYASGDDLLAAGLPTGRRSCLVVDQDMPGTTGLDLLATLRSAGHRLPAILATGVVDARGRVEQGARRIADTVFLHKPIEADQFVRCIRDCLDRFAPA